VAALRTLLEFTTTCGDEFLSLLPETLSFVSEVMEDDHTEVVSLTHSLVRKLEELSGESMQEYLKR
jgi:U3 small nucleolar RNA-associated protein 10